MLRNRDRVSRPSKGRFFPLSVAQILGLLHELGFKHSDFRTRVDLLLQNAVSTDLNGILVAAFYPSDALVSYSFASEFPLPRAEVVLRAAIREFRAIDVEVTQTWSRQEVISYRAYLTENNQLRITRRARTSTLAKYRGGAKFSNAFKPKKVATDERPFRQISVT